MIVSWTDIWNIWFAVYIKKKKIQKDRILKSKDIL